MKTKLITLVVGARPNFMKISPIIRALETQKNYFSYRLVNTGQHNDKEMSNVFFDELGIPEPDKYLNAGGETHGEQTAITMIEFEKDCIKYCPDLVLVVGDINSTAACAITAKKLNIKLAHVESGLRSFDRDMPEEINRLLVDSITDYYFVSEESGVENLLKEGHDKKNIHFVGNVMIDNLFYQNERLDNKSDFNFSTESLKVKLNKYALLTLHRPSNVDFEIKLKEIVGAINKISKEMPIIFSVHPRTKKRLKEFNIEFSPNVFLIGPVPYLEFLNLWRDAQVVLTDSGGLQEETTALGVSCVTIRENTERPVTVSKGTNLLAGTAAKDIEHSFRMSLKSPQKKLRPIFLWDGLAAMRIVEILRWV